MGGFRTFEAAEVVKSLSTTRLEHYRLNLPTDFAEEARKKGKPNTKEGDDALWKPTPGSPQGNKERGLFVDGFIALYQSRSLGTAYKTNGMPAMTPCFSLGP